MRQAKQQSIFWLLFLIAAIFLQIHFAPFKDKIINVALVSIIIISTPAFLTFLVIYFLRKMEFKISRYTFNNKQYYDTVCNNCNQTTPHLVLHQQDDFPMLQCTKCENKTWA